MEIKVIVIGNPDLKILTQDEQKEFFETVLANIKKLSKSVK